MTRNIEYTLYDQFEELTPEQQTLIKAAQEACSTSYSPYSNFCVGSAVLLEDGTIVRGSNQENAAYPDGLCAERVALFFAGSNYSKMKVKKIAVIAKKASDNNYLAASPCGSCRQVMLEYEVKQVEPIELITLWEGKKFLVVKSVSTLLPFSFTKDQL